MSCSNITEFITHIMFFDKDNSYNVHVKKNYHLYDVQIIIELPPNYNCFDSLFEDLISVKLGVLVKKKKHFLKLFYQT